MRLAHARRTEQDDVELAKNDATRSRWTIRLFRSSVTFLTRRSWCSGQMRDMALVRTEQRLVVAWRPRLWACAADLSWG